jgi:enoyl-CoA hydratase
MMSTDQFSNLRISPVEDVVQVSLSRGPVNAVNQAMYREIRDFFSNVDTLVPTARAVVLTGEGKHFCAGNDLDEFAGLTSENSPGRMREVHQAFTAIAECSIPVIGAVQGVALGTGLCLAASCDFVIAADDARFGVPELTVGVMGAARHLQRLVPQGLTRWMYYTSETITAERLYELGGVVAVVAREELLRAALDHARVVTRHSAQSLRLAKYAMDTIESMELGPGYAFEQSLTSRFADHPDSREAMLAVRENRPPNYNHEWTPIVRHNETP